MGIRVLIVDDEPLGRQALHSLVERDPQVTRILEAATGRDAIGFLQTQSADVVFLDVQPPDMDGVSVVSEFKSHELPAIIFVTAHEQYAVEAFNLSAVDYLLKPVGAQRFGRAFEKAKTQLRSRGSGALDESAVSPPPSSSSGTQEPLRQIAVRQWTRLSSRVETDNGLYKLPPLSTLNVGVRFTRKCLGHPCSLRFDIADLADAAGLMISPQYGVLSQVGRNYMLTAAIDL